MSTYTLFTKRVGLVGITNLIMNLRGLILLPILTKTLGADGYGAWSQILVTISLVMPFIMLGLPSSMVRFLPAEKKNVGKGFFTVFFTILLTSVVFALFLLLASESLATLLLKDASLALIFKIASALVVLEALNQTSLQAFRIFGQIKKYSMLAIVQTFIEIGLVAFLVLSGFGLVGAILSILITRGVILLLSLYLVISHIGFSLPDFSVLRPYLLFGMPLIPSVVFEIIVASSDRYAIGFFMGASPVGIYSAAYGIGSIILVFLGPISYILSPTVFKSYDEGKIDEVKSYLSYSLKYFLMFSIPSVIGLAILAKPLLVALTTSEFVLSGMFIIPLVALSMVFEGVRAIFGEVLMLFKRTKIFGIASIVAGLINLILNIALIPYFGIIAAAVTTLLSYGILGFIMYYISRKYMKFELNLSFILKSVVSSIIMIFVIRMLSPIGAVMILLTVGIGAVVYFCALFLLKGFEREELKIISEIIGLGGVYERLR